MATPVRISDIALYLRCPRLVYFDALSDLHRKVSTEHLLLRGLMLGLSEDGPLKNQLFDCLEKLKQELPVIFGDEIDLQELGQSAREVEALIPGMAQGLASVASLILPSEVELDLRSERIGLSGRLDRLVTKEPTPSIIRTGSAPQDGVWKKDRLQLAGYAMLVEERCGIRIKQGLIEYPRSGTIRLIQIHSVDRSRILRLRDRIAQIKEGRLPDKPNEPSCDGCEVRDKCETRVSLASKFF
jgi:CRISPR-associated exonuclease Cas4